MKKYHTVSTTLLVKPVDEPIFSDFATEVMIDDEGGGFFVVVKQSTDKDSSIRIDLDEWPHIKDAIEKQIATCAELNKKEDTE